MKSQGHISPLNSYDNNLTSGTKDNELVEMSERKFRCLLLKMFSDLKEDSNQQINKVKKSIQDLDKKDSNMEEKFSKEMEIMKNYQEEILEIEASRTQIQTKVDSITRRQDQIEERISEMEDKIWGLVHTSNHKVKNKQM
jgi:septal ring factor EnvC (AmiA/AmiB activator)